MTKILRTKYKASRKLLTDIWGRAKDSLKKRNYKPGQHGKRMYVVLSDYGIHFKEKQKVKAHYGRVSEKQIKRYFNKAKNSKGNTATNFFSSLERRLDVVVYRANLALTIFGARQLVSHKHIRVNDKMVNIASYSLNPNDVISLSDKASRFNFISDSLDNKERIVPDYIELDKKNKKAKLLNLVEDPSEVPFPFKLDFNLVIEYYSR